MTHTRPSDGDILREAERYARNATASLKPSHGWDHIQRVVRLAVKIATVERADIFIVHTAAILHDIARPQESASHGAICHAETGSRMAYEFLLGAGLDEARARHIAECVLSHRFRNDHTPRTIEAMALYDADKLDSIGAIGIGRAFLFAGEVGARLHNPDADIDATSAYTEEDTAYREFIVKLRRVKDSMITAEGRRIAAARHEFMVRFFERLQSEALGQS